MGDGAGSIQVGGSPWLMQLLRKECKHLSPLKLPVLLSLAHSLLPRGCSVTAPAPGITASSRQDEGRKRKHEVKQ